MMPSVRKAICLIVLKCLGGILPSAAVAQTIVWTDANAGKIQKKEVGGGAVSTIIQFPSPQSAGQIHYDPITAKLYYHYGPPSSFQRANLDGSDPETIPTPSVGIFSLNVVLRKLYWIVGFNNVLNYSELNGSGAGSHTYSTCCLLTLEAVGDDLYFGAGGQMEKGIWRADADGSNEQFLHVTSQPIDLAYDPVENKIYVAAISEISRMNLDGTAVQTVFPQASGQDQIVVDSRSRKLYWADRDAKAVRRIRRSNIDGSNVEDFVIAADVGNPNFDIRGLTIVYSSTPIPTLSVWGLMAMSVIILAVGLVVLRKQFKSKGATDVQYPT